MITQFDIDHDMQLHRLAFSLVAAERGYSEWVQEADEQGCPPSKLVSIWQAAERAFCSRFSVEEAFPLSVEMDGRFFRKFRG
jgi:hypothetical protein